MANDAQKTFRRTRIVKLLDGAEALLEVAREEANHTQSGRQRPLMPAGFRQRIGGLIVEFDKRKRAILAEDVT